MAYMHYIILKVMFELVGSPVLGYCLVVSGEAVDRVAALEAGECIDAVDEALLYLATSMFSMLCPMVQNYHLPHWKQEAWIVDWSDQVSVRIWQPSCDVLGRVSECDASVRSKTTAMDEFSGGWGWRKRRHYDSGGDFWDMVTCVHRSFRKGSVFLY